MSRGRKKAVKPEIEEVFEAKEANEIISEPVLKEEVAEVVKEEKEEVVVEEDVIVPTATAKEVKDKEVVTIVNFPRRSPFAVLNGQQAKVLVVNKNEAVVETSSGKFIISFNNIKR